MRQSDTSLPALVMQRAASHPEETIIRSKNRGIWKTVTWRQLAGSVQQIGEALLSANFDRGDVVAILSETRPEAVYADLAIFGCGAASVAIDPDDNADRVGHKLASAGIRLAFVENEEQLDKVLSIRHRCPALSRIVVFDRKGIRNLGDEICLALSQFIQTAGVVDWNGSVEAISVDDPAVVLFPSCDQSPTGQTLTHGDLMQTVTTAGTRLRIQPNDERLAVLKLSDITERIWGIYLALERRCVSNYLEGPDTLIENLRELKPTILGVDAVVWERLHALVLARSKASTSAQRSIYEWAVSAGRHEGAIAWLADLLVLRAVRREFGLSRLRLAYVGGASVSPAVLDWAKGLGITIQRLDDPTAAPDHIDQRYQALMQNACV